MKKPQNLKSFVKKNFRGAYDVAGAFKNGLKVAKARQAIESKIVVVHEAPVSLESPLRKIVVNTGPARLNLVFKNFSAKTLEEKEKSDFLSTAISFSANQHYALRIISRNSQPSPRTFTSFIKTRRLETPESYSFYTDRSTRLSSSVRRLDVSSGDIFFTENQLAELKTWTKEIK